MAIIYSIALTKRIKTVSLSRMFFSGEGQRIKNFAIIFDLIKISRANDDDTPARSFNDYKVKINQDGLPKGVKIIIE